MSDKICGNCFHVDTKPTGECECAIDNEFMKVGYYDEKDCFESRSGVFDNEKLINFDD